MPFDDDVRRFLSANDSHTSCTVGMCGEDTCLSPHHDLVVALDQANSVIGCVVTRELFPPFPLPLTVRLENIAISTNISLYEQTSVLGEMVEMTIDVLPPSSILQLTARPSSVDVWEGFQFQHTHTVFPFQSSPEAVFTYSQNPYCREKMRKLDSRNPSQLRTLSVCHAAGCHALGIIPTRKVSIPFRCSSSARLSALWLRRIQPSGFVAWDV